MKSSRKPLSKRLPLMVLSLCVCGTLSYATPVDLGVGYDDPVGTMPDWGKGPVTIPSVDLDGYELTFLSSHDDYTLELLQDGVVVYSTFVSSSTSTVVLPTTLQGQYEIRLYGDESYYLIGYIAL